MNFPLRGYTPKLDRPKIESPVTAIAFALSPSVRIKVHLDLGFPASFASSNFSVIIFGFFLLRNFALFRSLYIVNKEDQRR